MAIASYSDLTTAIGEWAGDTAATISSFYDDFIALAEAEFNRTLRVREMEATTSLTPDSDSKITLPDDYLEWRRVTALTTPRRRLEYQTPDYLEEHFPYREADNPAFFTVEGTSILVLPKTSSNVELAYYQRLTGLSGSNTSNWLLAKYPNLYLHGVLYEAAKLQQDPEMAASYRAMRDEDMRSLRRDDQQARWARGSIRVNGPTP